MVLHKKEGEGVTRTLEKKLSRLDREEILLNDHHAWQKLSDIIEKGERTEVAPKKRQLKCLAK